MISSSAAWRLRGFYIYIENYQGWKRLGGSKTINHLSRKQYSLKQLWSLGLKECPSPLCFFFPKFLWKLGKQSLGDTQGSLESVSHPPIPAMYEGWEPGRQSVRGRDPRTWALPAPWQVCISRKLEAGAEPRFKLSAHVWAMSAPGRTVSMTHAQPSTRTLLLWKAS